MSTASSDPLPNARFAAFAYRWRWLLSAVVVGLIALAGTSAMGRVQGRTEALGSLGDNSNGSGVLQPLVFDPTFDVWFGDADRAVRTFYEIEERFVAEDYVMVTFETDDSPYGVFGRDSLATIARLTERFLTVPGVRHVRSLTYNPWIRWGSIEDEAGFEEGLLISDLVEGDPATLSDDDIVERMIAVLGAERVAQRLGEARVRAVLGPDANFGDFIGEPLLLGTILNESGTTTAIQVQVLRPRVDPERLERAFADDPDAKNTAAALYSVQYQRAAVRGIEHFLRMEHGLAIPTPEFDALEAWIAAQPAGEAQSALYRELRDPTRNFMADEHGELVRKFLEYDAVVAGVDEASGVRFVDRSDPTAPLEAPADFRPRPLSDYTFKLGGVPFFERNFENVGLADSRYIPLMFLVIIICLALIFRGVVGVVVPLMVVFGSIIGMLGMGFAKGDLFNNLTIMSPNMLTAVAIADAIHLVAAWVALRSKFDDKRALIVEVLRRNALPVFLTSVTTAIGFYSLTVSGLAPVRMLGYTAGFGTLLAYLLSMTLVPAVLSLVPHRSGARTTRGSQAAGFFTEERSDRYVARLLRVRKPILALAGSLAVMAAVGLTRVEIDTDFRGMFPDDNPTMSDFRWIESRMGGVGDLEIVFTGLGADRDQAMPLAPAEEQRLSELRLRRQGAVEFPDEFAALDSDEREELSALAVRERDWNAVRIGVSPRFLDSLDAFEQRLRMEMADSDSDLAVITDLISPLDILRKMHQVQHENRATFYRVPREGDVPEEFRQAQLGFDEWTEEWSLVPAQSGASLVAQYYLQYENGARPGENLATQLSIDRTRFRMQGRVVQASSMDHQRAFRRIEEIAQTEFPELAASMTTSARADSGDVLAGPTTPVSDFTISGKTLLFARTSHLFTMGFIQSMSIALVVITLIIGLIFRSVRLALVSLVPNVLPIVLPLSVFGLLGVPLHGPAILVSTVALGVCVDDTIHFLTKFVRARKAGRSIESALSYVLQESGSAITITTVVLMIGFATLLLSDFTPNFMMGALATFMIGLAWIADLVVTPVVLSLYAGASEATDSNADAPQRASRNEAEPALS